MRKMAINEKISYSITDEEKKGAKEAIDIFNATGMLLSKSMEYLSAVKEPFNSDPNIAPEKIWQHRSAMWKFRDQFIKKIEQFKIASFKCMVAIKPFSFDTQIINLSSAFSNSIEDFEKNMVDFEDLFKDLKSKNFGTELLGIIEKLDQDAEKIRDLVTERIITYIQKNIISANWADEISSKIQATIGERSRPIVDIENSKG